MNWRRMVLGLENVIVNIEFMKRAKTAANRTLLSTWVPKNDANSFVSVLCSGIDIDSRQWRSSWCGFRFALAVVRAFYKPSKWLLQQCFVTACILP